ncbi:hypothetical protein Tco_1399252, partial [Tanacetum coccineum]
KTSGKTSHRVRQKTSVRSNDELEHKYSNWDGVTCDDSTGDVIRNNLNCGMLKEGLILKGNQLEGEVPSVGDFSVIDGHLGNDDLLETNEISYLA